MVTCMTRRSAQNPADGEDPLDDSGAAKTVFLAVIAQIIEGGGAMLTLSGAGTSELRLASGEVFQLGNETLTRVA